MFFNSSAPIDAILDFWQCCLQNLTTYFEKDLKKYCTYDQKEQLFFKYFSIRILDFEETFAEDIVCSALGADELSYMYARSVAQIYSLIL